MPATFHEDGVRFQYPENWRLTREANANGWTVALYSPGTAFVLVTFDADMPDIELMAQTALEAMQAEYDSLESEETYEVFAGQRAFGHEMRFFSFDLTNTCWTRSFFSPRGTVQVFWQANDLELESVRPVLDAILASVKIDEEE